MIKLNAYEKAEYHIVNINSLYLNVIKKCIKYFKLY